MGCLTYPLLWALSPPPIVKQYIAWAGPAAGIRDCKALFPCEREGLVSCLVKSIQQGGSTIVTVRSEDMFIMPLILCNAHNVQFLSG